MSIVFRTISDYDSSTWFECLRKFVPKFRVEGRLVQRLLNAAMVKRAISRIRITDKACAVGRSLRLFDGAQLSSESRVHMS